MSKKVNWLDEAKGIIDEFHNTKYGKMTQNQLRASYAGKIGSKQGRKNLEKARNTNGHQSKAASVSGKNHVKSGHWAKCIQLGAEASKNKYAKMRMEKLQTIYDGIEEGKEYTKTELIKMFPNVKNIPGTLICNEAQNYLRRNLKCKGATATYSKLTH